MLDLIGTFAQSKPYVLSRYYGCDSVIPVVIPSKLKISFQARKSPGAFLPLSQPILVRFSKFFFLLKGYEKGFQKQAQTVVLMVSVLQAPLGDFLA